MKKMRKLLPALAMLLVSAIMMSTASFAWFTMNTAVTATGMTVTAKSSGGLVIAKNAAEYGTPANEAFGDAVNMSTGAWTNFGANSVKIEPASRGLTDSDAWWTAQAGSSISADKKADSAYIKVDTPASHYYKTALYFKSLDENDKTGTPGNLLLQSISIGNNTSNLNPALRVALRVMDMTTANDGKDPATAATGTWYFFAPMRQNITNKYVDGDATATATAYVTGDNIYGYTSMVDTDDENVKKYNFNNIDIADLMFNEAVRVEVYIYFEGEDAACTSLNAQILDNISIALNFGLN